MPKPLLPLFARQMGASFTEVGLIASTQAIATVLTGIPLGAASDRLGRGRFVSFGLLLMGVASLGFYMSSSILHLYFFSALAGVGMGTFEPAMQASVGDFARTGRVASAFGYFSSSVQAGVASAPAVGAYVASLSGFHTSFALSGLILLLASVLSILMRLPQSGRGVAREVKEEAALALGRPVLAGWMNTLFTFLIIGGVYTFFPVYASEEGVDVFTIGLVFSAHSAITVVARPFFGAYADRFAKRTLLMTLGASVMGLSTALLSQVFEPRGLFAAMVLLAAGTVVSIPLAGTMIAEWTTHGNRGTAMGVTTSLRFTGQGIGQASLGAFASLYGFAVGFPILGAAGMLGAVLVYMVGRRY